MRAAPHQVPSSFGGCEQVGLRNPPLPTPPPASKCVKSIKLNESSCCFKEIKGSHIKKPRDFEWRGREIYMNVDFFFLAKYHLAMQTLGSPGECSHQQGWDGTDSRDGCLCPPHVATARKAANGY